MSLSGHPSRRSSFGARWSTAPSTDTIGPEYYCLFVLIEFLHYWTYHSFVCFHSFGFASHAPAKVRFSGSFYSLAWFTVLALGPVHKDQRMRSLLLLTPSIFLYVSFGDQSQGSQMLLCHVWRVSVCCLTLLTCQSCWSCYQPCSWNQFPFNVPFGEPIHGAQPTSYKTRAFASVDFGGRSACSCPLSSFPRSH